MKADVRIFKDIDALCLSTAEIFAEAVALAIQERRRFLVALSGGSTPTATYRLLANDPFRSRIQWQRTFVFWGDERCVPPEDEGSNYYQAYRTLLKHVPIPTENIQRIRGELEPTEAVDDYTQAIKRFAAPGLNWPRFDLTLLGMGADGHTASLFPGSKVEAGSPVLTVTAHYQDRPAQRVTLTPVVFNSSRMIVFLVTGKDKAEALSRVLSDEFNPEQLPAQRIHPTNGQLIWLVDEAAATNL